MEKRKLGSVGPEVPVICLGGNVYGWTVAEAEAFRQLDAALDAGLNFVDTADVYSRWVPGHKGGESETIIGNWLKRTGNRNKVIIATKVGMEMGPTARGFPGLIFSARWSAHSNASRRITSTFTSPIRMTRRHPSTKRWRRTRSSSNRGRCLPSGLRTIPRTGLPRRWR